MTPLVFFSFVAMPGADTQAHRAYNRWHQLDHRPINLALPGVAWGDRWARPAGYRAHGQAAAPHTDTDYVAMYWFKEPVEQSVRAWTELGEASFQLGRGPLIPGVTRTMLGFFKPVKGYAAASALVAPDVLPYRPNQGLHLTLTRQADHHGPATHDHHIWEDRVLLPRLLETEGVAGAWTFSFSHYQAHTTLPFRPDGDDAPGSMRVRLLYLDGEPLATTSAVADAVAELEADGRGAPDCQRQVLLSTPLKTIMPWQDW